jgi:hypothetical protein
MSANYLKQLYIHGFRYKRSIMKVQKHWFSCEGLASQPYKFNAAARYVDSIHEVSALRSSFQNQLERSKLCFGWCRSLKLLISFE